MKPNKKFTMIIRIYDIYMYFYERIINLALSQFEWQGLPDTCDRLYLERCALVNGSAAFSIPKGSDIWLSTGYLPVSGPIPNKYINEYLGVEKDRLSEVEKDYLRVVKGERIGDIERQLATQNGYKNYIKTYGRFDVYGYPVNIRGVGYNAEQWECEKWEIFYDNMTKQSLIPKIDLYAKMLTEIYCTMRNNVRQQNTPYVISTPKNKSYSFKELFRAVFSFEPVIELNSQFTEDEVKVFPLQAPYIGQDLMELAREVWNECLNMLGISTATAKKERLITEEIYLDRQADLLSLNSRLLNRVDFCNKMNRRHGLNLSVNLSTSSMDIEELFRGAGIFEDEVE